MRSAVEAQRRSLAFRVRAARQVARKQQRSDARDVRLESQRKQIELQFDVLIEGLWNTDRDAHIGRSHSRGLHCDLKSSLDFSNVVSVLIESFAIGRARLLFEPRETAGQRIENAAVSGSARRALIRGCAVAKHSLENHLWI